MALYGTVMGASFRGITSGSDYTYTTAVGMSWMRGYVDWPWPSLLTTPDNHLSSWSSSALGALATGLSNLHGQGKRAIVVAHGVPKSINPLAYYAGGYTSEYWPLDDAGDIAFAAYCAKLASYLDPTKDILQIGNEINSTYYVQGATYYALAGGNVGDQAPARIGATLRKAVNAVRIQSPTLPVLSPPLCTVGTTGDPHSMAVWGSQMISAVPQLLTTSRFDAWSVHPYTFLGGVSGTNSPLGTQGTNGHVQADAWRQVLLNAGWTSPGLVITEHGEPSLPSTYNSTTGTYGPYTETWQRDHAVLDYQAIDSRRAAGWYIGPEIRRDVVDRDNWSAEGYGFGVLRRFNAVKKPSWTTVNNRALLTTTQSSNIVANPGAGDPTVTGNLWTLGRVGT